LSGYLTTFGERTTGKPAAAPDSNLGFFKNFLMFGSGGATEHKRLSHAVGFGIEFLARTGNMERWRRLVPAQGLAVVYYAYDRAVMAFR